MIRHSDFAGERIAIFPIGVSGSGKSFLFSKKKFKNWAFVNADEMRRDRLSKMRRKKMVIDANGVKKLADPDDPSHIFHPSLRDWVLDESQKQISKLARASSNMILDLTNVHLQRVYAFNLLRGYDYKLIAVVFEPGPTGVHLRNVKKRSHSGGIDISSRKGREADRERRRIIDEQKRCMKCFLGSLRVGRMEHQRLEKVPPQYLKTALPSIEKYLESIPRRYVKTIKKLIRLDCVDVVLTV